MLENKLKSTSLPSHRASINLNKIQNAWLSGFFLKILNSIFQSIKKDVDHKLLLHYF